MTDLQIEIPLGCYRRIALDYLLNISLMLALALVRFLLKYWRCFVYFGQGKFLIKKGDRIAQLICEKIEHPALKEVLSFGKTQLGKSGFGSNVAIVIFVWIYTRVTVGRCYCDIVPTAKVALITGATSGIGKETAIALALRGCSVILACRNLNKANQVADEIRKRNSNANVRVVSLDLCDFKSVRECAQQILKQESRLDLLINNAGVGVPSKLEYTKDGFELTYQANYLGHFLLTHILLDLLKETPSSRIINVSSIQHHLGRNSSLLQQRWSDKWPCFGTFLYGDTKLAQIHMTKTLANLLDKHDVTVTCLHPGYVRTNIFQPYGNIVQRILRWLSVIFAKTAEEGAQTTLHLALSLKFENGGYYTDCKKVTPSKAALDEVAAEKLYINSLRDVGLQSLY